MLLRKRKINDSFLVTVVTFLTVNILSPQGQRMLFWRDCENSKNAGRKLPHYSFINKSETVEEKQKSQLYIS